MYSSWRSGTSFRRSAVLRRPANAAWLPACGCSGTRSAVLGVSCGRTSRWPAGGGRGSAGVATLSQDRFACRDGRHSPRPSLVRPPRRSRRKVTSGAGRFGRPVGKRIAATSPPEGTFVSQQSGFCEQAGDLRYSGAWQAAGGPLAPRYSGNSGTRPVMGSTRTAAPTTTRTARNLRRSGRWSCSGPMGGEGDRCRRFCRSNNASIQRLAKRDFRVVLDDVPAA